MKVIFFPMRLIIATASDVSQQLVTSIFGQILGAESPLLLLVLVTLFTALVLAQRNTLAHSQVPPLSRGWHC